MLNKSSIWFLNFLFFILFACSNKHANEIISDKGLAKIRIGGNIDNLLQIDSIFSEIRAIPLETKAECLISKISKCLFYHEKIYIQNERSNLFVFDTLGKFLFEVGKKGRGPGEFSVLRDFDIDQNGRIFVLDFLKIIEYNNDGVFHKNYSFHFTPNDELLINPIQFSIKKDGNFFIWAGSFSIKANPKDKLHIMYEMSRKGKILNKYFPLKYKLPSETNQFKHYKNSILIDPIFGSNIVYSINEEGKVKAKYYIDFGSKTMNKVIPSNFESLTEFKLDIDSRYYHTISGFSETDEWLYFRFLYDRHFFNVYYSKKLNKSFISKPYPRIYGRIAPWEILCSNEDKFVSFIEPIIVSEDMSHTKINELSNYEKNILISLGKIKATDNPILFICFMKKY